MKALYIYAHMDDETILSYGTVARNRDGQNSVLTICGLGRAGASSADRRNAYEKICRRDFGCGSVRTMDIHDLDMSGSIDYVRTFVDRIIREDRPDSVYTHSPHDLHFEHRMLFDIVLACCRPAENRRAPGALYASATPAGNIWSFGQYGGFNPTVFYDISEFRTKKREALLEYGPETRHSDARGADGILRADDMYGMQAGFGCAEAYELVYMRS